MRTLLLLLALLAGSPGWAERIEIDAGDDPNSRLEIRNVVLPGGAEAQLYVIQGSPVTVTIGDRQLVADHIEVDLTNRLVRVVGFGTFVTPEQTVQGSDLTIELERESLTGDDVLIITQAIDVSGAEVTRVPGQIDVMDGSFSPCSRCAQEVEDYGFRAERILLYPGDRLVAFQATVLVRGYSVLELPLLVVPLARPDRQPRFTFRQGSSTQQAHIGLDWPYVSGPNAFGTFSVRYYAEVDPLSGSGPQPLGGRVTESYLGGGIDHVFYTDRGQGNAVLFYLPGGVEGGGESRRPRFTVRLAYQTDQQESGEESRLPSVDLEVIRDDDRRDRLVEYRLSLGGLQSGLRGTVFSQGFADLDPSDEVDTPSYDDRATARRTPLRLLLEPEEEQFSVGPLLLRRLALELGAFEDASNPGNRSAAQQRYIDAGRLLERHAIELRPQPLWTGMEISGSTNFVGQYYTTGERQIDWDTRLSGRQRLGGTGSFGVVFTRDVNEGETPFRFDQIPLRTRVDLRSALNLQPLPWLAFEAQEVYVFRDTRRPELEGFGPLDSQLRLFGNLAWLDVSLSNSYELETGDPGKLDVEVALRSPEPGVRAALEIEHSQDLSTRPDRLTGEAINETETAYQVNFGLSALQLDLSGGYRYYPAEPEAPEESAQHWLPFEVGLTIGTLQQEDAIPGIRLAYQRNMNERRVEALSFQAQARLGVVELAAEQRFDLPDGGVSRSLLSATYPGFARFEATGFTLLPPRLLGLPEGEPRSARYTVTLRDDPVSGREQWQLRYLTRYDPDLASDHGTGGFRDSSLETRVLLEEERLGATRFSVDLFLDLQIRDDLLPLSYLRRASLELAADIEGVVGVQGALGYRGVLNTTSGELSRAELRLDEVAVTVRARDDLFVGALFDDVWDLTGGTADQPPFDLRPELFVVWDRCCWALMAGWNTETGQLRLSVTAPGAQDGLTQVIDSPLVLPGRGTQ